MRIQNTGRAALAAFVLSVLAAAPAAAASCSNATLSGAYGVMSAGSSGPNSPTTGVFRLVADGAGHVTGTGVQSDDGNIQGESFSGTYTVTKDCTGTMALVDQASIHADYNFVFDEKTSHFEFVRTDNGFNESGEGAAQGDATCSLPSKKAVFADRLKQPSIYLVDIAGQMTVAPTGKISAEETVSINGTVTSLKMSGVYSVNSNCTGYVQLKGGGNNLHFNTQAVDDGKLLYVINIDPSIVISGTITPQ